MMKCSWVSAALVFEDKDFPEAGPNLGYHSLFLFQAGSFPLAETVQMSVEGAIFEASPLRHQSGRSCPYVAISITLSNIHYPAPYRKG